MTDLAPAPDDPWLHRIKEVPPPPDGEQLLFARVVYAAQQLHREGITVTAANLHQFNPALKETPAADILSTARFEAALLELGILPAPGGGLAPEQMAALAIYMDMSVPLTHAQKLRAAKVTQAQWNGWMRQTEFARRVNELAADVLKDSIPVAKQRLAQLVDSGNLSAITLAFEMEGVHDRRKETVDTNQILMQLFSILDEEISDVRVLERIADKVKQRMMGQAPVLKITPRELEESV